MRSSFRFKKQNLWKRWQIEARWIWEGLNIKECSRGKVSPKDPVKELHPGHHLLKFMKQEWFCKKGRSSSLRNNKWMDFRGIKRSTSKSCTLVRRKNKKELDKKKKIFLLFVRKGIERIEDKEIKRLDGWFHRRCRHHHELDLVSSHEISNL